MSRIFLSHSSKDDFAAIAVRTWLNENGWDDVFLDLDAKDGIHPGEKWERALYEHATRCEAVVFLVSQNWIASDWCRREYELARRLNKRIFVVVIDQTTIPELPGYLTETHQAVSLGVGADHQVRRVERPGTHEEGFVTFSAEGLARLKSGLTQAGLDPRFFPWPPANDPDREPYRGLEPLEQVDAGIFFGRDAPVIEALDALRGVREGHPPRLFVILGASGAGKSSFLRAGLLPRLARDDRNFLPLQPIRPERAAITGTNGLITVLTGACAAHRMSVTRAELRDAAAKGADALRPTLHELAERARAMTSSPTMPTIVLAIDQAEELFRAEGAQEGEALLTLLRDLALVDAPAIIALFCIRSDSYDALEHAKPFEGLSQRAFPLLPMPRGAYQTVIEGPARRFERGGRKFEIDPSLTEALLADIEKGAGSDALPLLAFTLGQLFTDHRAAGRLTRADYETFGGLKGAIDAAFARALTEADRDARIPKDSEARLTLLRRGLIPWLAGIDPDTRTPRRRRAPASQIPAEARPLIDLLVEQRLLTRAVDDVTQEVTLEPAHEALLRQWGNLKGWLEEDFARLVALEGVQRAARDWDANARDPAWAAHGGGRLDEAMRLDTRPDLAARLEPVDRAYLVACREKQNAVHAREQALAAAEARAAQRTKLGLAASIVLALLAAGAAVYGFNQAKDARAQKAVAETQRQEAITQTEEAQRQRQETERQKQEAERQKTLAEQQQREANAQRIAAEQRSAVLAANVAQALTAEGELDQALLLMLDTTRVFDDATVPDKIRIAFSKALMKRERARTVRLFPRMQVFDVDGALLLTDPATNDIWKLTDSVTPTRLLAGSPGDARIESLRQTASGRDYVILRTNFDVERINAATGARRKIGSLPMPKDRQSTAAYEDVLPTITPDGLVVRRFMVKTARGEGWYVQALDAETGTLMQGDAEIPDFVLTVRRRPGGGLYAYSTEQLYELTPGRDRFNVQRARLSERDRLAVQLGDCFPPVAGYAKDAEARDLKDEIAVPTTDGPNCRKFGADYLIDYATSTSAGPERTDLLFRKGKKITLRDVLKEHVTLPSANFAAVAAMPVALQSKERPQQLAILLNSVVYVLSMDEGDSWTLRLNFRHPGFVQAARFLSADELIVIDPEAGQITVHDLSNPPKQQFFTTETRRVIGKDEPVPAIHFGTCVGGPSTPYNATVARLPDGRQLELDAAGEKSEIRISDGKVIKLPDTRHCVEFALDWSRMLIVTDKSTSIYDLRGVLARGSIEGQEIGSLPIGATSALFAGSSGKQIVTTNMTNRVQMWSETGEGKRWAAQEIFKGENPILYAEPDEKVERLIIFESEGGGTVLGSVYSLSAREVWYDLGSEYKNIGAIFTPNGEVVVSHGGTWTDVFPIFPLSRLAELAEQNLSPDCRPPAPRDYRKSRCWPATGQ